MVKRDLEEFFGVTPATKLPGYRWRFRSRWRRNGVDQCLYANSEHFTGIPKSTMSFFIVSLQNKNKQLIQL